MEHILKSFYVENAYVAAALTNIIIKLAKSIHPQVNKTCFSFGDHPHPAFDNNKVYIHSKISSCDNSPLGTYSVQIIGNVNIRQEIINTFKHIEKNFDEGEIIDFNNISFTITSIKTPNKLEKPQNATSKEDSIGAAIHIGYIINQNPKSTNNKEYEYKKYMAPQIALIAIREIIDSNAKNSIQLSNGWGVKSDIKTKAYLFDSYSNIIFDEEKLEHLYGGFQAHICYDSRNENCKNIAKSLTNELSKIFTDGAEISTKDITLSIQQPIRIIEDDNMWNTKNLNGIIFAFSFDAQVKQLKVKNINHTSEV